MSSSISHFTLIPQTDLSAQYSYIDQLIMDLTLQARMQTGEVDHFPYFPLVAHRTRAAHSSALKRESLRTWSVETRTPRPSLTATFRSCLDECRRHSRAICTQFTVIPTIPQLSHGTVFLNTPSSLCEKACLFRGHTSIESSVSAFTHARMSGFAYCWMEMSSTYLSPSTK